ncbi:MAG: DUF444 family protein [Bacteroidales bacterium]|nr:DUF444 family protein [Bacteroidales bacterium]
MKQKFSEAIQELLYLGLTYDEAKLVLENNQYEVIFNEHQLNKNIYLNDDFDMLQDRSVQSRLSPTSLKTLEDLIEQDNQRVKDGFPRRIRIGKLVKPTKDNKGQVIIVPTTTEPKFYHDNRITEDPNDLGETGGTGDEQEGDILGEQQAQPQQGEGEGQGAGEGGGEGHDISQEAFDLGKVLTEQFQLPNLKDKGQKRSLVKYTYDLTDIKKGFGQLLDKKATMKELIKKNIMLGNIGEYFNAEDLIIAPSDHVFRIMSKEQEFESQALVFFIRDYSGSMQGGPTEAISSQHLLIYSWLMYQYQNRVETKFILHDTDAKEVEDFYVYYQSNIAGGTKVAPAFELVDKIINEEQLEKDYNIYIFYGTDGDDWESDGKKTIEMLKHLVGKVNRIGVTVAKNSWSSSKKTTVETYLDKSELLNTHSDVIKIDAFKADGVTQDRIVEGIKKLVS